MVVLLGVSGCAPVSDPSWQPPRWSETQGVAVELTSLGGEEIPQPHVLGAGSDTSGLEFFEGRIRNDAAKLQIRYVEIPGSNTFNGQVAALVRAAIHAAGGEFSPQVYDTDAGLSDRGCVEGSLDWSAEQLLAIPATGPKGGEGTAMTCDVVSAFGDFVGVGFRTVTSGEGGVSDSLAVLYASVSDGGDAPGELWVDGAAEMLWSSAVNHLRREAGALSGGEVEPPGSAQLGLATTALGSAEFLPDGGATFTMPAGLTAPELEQLGIEPTSEPIRVELDADSLAAFGSAQLTAMREQQDEPFVGMPPWTAAQAVDCSIVACIALTYDDGPGPFTNRLLDTLRRHRAAVTFYMLGDRVAGDPDTVRRAAAEGHELGSHSMSHIDLTALPLRKAKAQVLDAKALIEEASGEPAPTFRPPYAAVDDAIIEAVDMPAIMWTIDTNDWQRPSRKKLVSRIVPVAKPGDIVLSHDIQENSVKVAGKVARGLQDRGFTLVTVSEMYDGDIPLEKVGW